MYEITLGDALPKAIERTMKALSPTTMRGILEQTGRVIGVTAESVVSDYPLPSGKPLEKFYTRTRADGSTYKSKFKTARQQGKVMALAKAGKIPYRRTGQLGRSITSGIQSVSERDVTVSIGTNLSYAPYVIDRVRQSHYHRGNWTPLQDDMEKGFPKIRQKALDTFVSGVNAAIKGKK